MFQLMHIPNKRLYLLKGANEFLLAHGQVAHGTHHAAGSGEQEQAGVQAGFARVRNQDDLRPGRNSLLFQHLRDQSNTGLRKMTTKVFALPCMREN